MGNPLGRRHGDGSVHGPRHPHDPRVDRPQLAGPDRYGTDLPGLRKGRWRPRRADLGALPRHAHRTGRAGCRLLHDPRRGAVALRAAHDQAGDGHRQSRRFDHGLVVPRPSQGELPLHPLRGDLRDHGRLRRGVLARRRPAIRARSPTPTTKPSSPSWTPSAS